MNRRQFLKQMALGAGALGLSPMLDRMPFLQEFPDAPLLARNCTYGMVNIRKRPTAESEVVKTIYEDTCLVWEKEVVGEIPLGRTLAKWIQTPEGYVYAPSFQPVKNLPNVPVTTMPETSIGKGMWVEVTVPYVDIRIINPPARSPWINDVPIPRMYYSQVIWVDDVQTLSDGNLYYRVNELYGNAGDLFYARADAFRPITPEEVAPISPNVEDKRIIINLAKQTVSCMEGSHEAYHCTVSTGAIYNAYGEVVEDWGTPVGPHPIWRKVISIHMSGGATGAGWDTMGIPWTMLFAGNGVALHSTFWHNGFGERLSHGCVNARPEDSKWIYRWCMPETPFDSGDKTVGMPGGTIIEVVEA